MLADEGYGACSEFREGCRKLGLDFAVSVASTTRVWTVDALGRRSGDPIEARRLAQGLAAAGAFRKYTWREGTAEPLHARFANHAFGGRDVHDDYVRQAFPHLRQLVEKVDAALWARLRL